MNPLRQDDPRHVKAVVAAGDNASSTVRLLSDTLVARVLAAYFKSLKDQGVVLVEAYAGDDAGRT